MSFFRPKYCKYLRRRYYGRRRRFAPILVPCGGCIIRVYITHVGARPG